MIYTTEFHAMGCTAIVQCDRADLLGTGRRRVLELEEHWSAFLPSSDLGRLNNGETVAVTEDTLLLVTFMHAGWVRTGGAFCPVTGHPAPGEVLAALLEAGSVLRLPEGTRLDPGAIGKGLAADVVAADLLAAGGTDVCVSIGGDLAFCGRPRPVPVLDAADGPPVALLAVREGGFATSVLRSARTGEPHVIDPGSGATVSGPFAQVTVAASLAAWAEIIATACLVRGSLEPAETARVGALGILVDGALRRSTCWQELDNGAATRREAPREQVVRAR